MPAAFIRVKRESENVSVMEPCSMPRAPAAIESSTSAAEPVWTTSGNFAVRAALPIARAMLLSSRFRRAGPAPDSRIILMPSTPFVLRSAT